MALLSFCKLTSREMILKLKRCTWRRLQVLFVIITLLILSQLVSSGSAWPSCAILTFTHVSRFMCAKTSSYAIDANPLLMQQDLPKFLSIQPDHVVPAIKHLVKETETGLDNLEILLQDDKTPKTWSSIFDVLEVMTSKLYYAWNVVNHLKSVKNSQELREAHQHVQPDVVKVSYLITQSLQVYNAMKALKMHSNQLDMVQKRIITNSILSARLGGAELTDEKRERFNKISQDLALLSNKYSDNVLDSAKEFELELSNKNDVDGLPDTLLQLMANKMDKQTDFRTGPWKLTLDMPCFEPFMKYSTNQNLREHLYRSFVKRASEGVHDNTQIIEDIRKLRTERASLLGYENYAALSLETKMAGSATNVWNLIESLKEQSKKASERELSQLQNFANENGFQGNLQLWDLPFWSERRRKHLFNVNDEILRPYFPLPKVLQGLFNLTSFLFGVQILPEYDSVVETWHPDVKFFKINDGNGNHIASFFLDPFSRPHEKNSGAWMNTCLDKSEVLGYRPVAYLVCNQSPPVNGVTSLMTFREVETLFHEFGHGLQHMLTEVVYSSAAGIHNIEWDAVEFPSQFMENWLYDEQTINTISGHYQTGEPLPPQLFQQIVKARKYMAGTAMLRQLYFAALDMELHTSSDPWLDVMRRVAKEYTIMEPLQEDRFPCSFQHIFSSGYAAGYYSYKWAEVMSADAFEAFKEVGLHNRDALAKTGRRFRDTVLALGGGTHPSEVYRQFRGRDPSPDALLRSYGLS